MYNIADGTAGRHGRTPSVSAGVEGGNESLNEPVAERDQHCALSGLELTVLPFIKSDVRCEGDEEWRSRFFIGS